eukprot:241687-Pelagomonas_calceolata.AAC.4
MARPHKSNCCMGVGGEGSREVVVMWRLGYVLWQQLRLFDLACSGIAEDSMLGSTSGVQMLLHPNAPQKPPLQ